MRTIPAVLSIDVEPDGFQLRAGDAPTTGYDAAVEAMGRLRPRLEQATGRPVRFGWFFRMDPQIAQVYGRADHLVAGFGDRVAGLLDAGDHVGLHTHAVRWDEVRGVWTHDLDDRGFVVDAYASGFAAFEEAFGVPCTRHRNGAGTYDQLVVDTLESLGTRVDSALEPIGGWRLQGHPVHTGVDSSPIVGEAVDCTGAPRRAYRPAPGDFLRGSERHDGLVLLPCTTSRLKSGQPGWRAAAGAVKRRERPPVRMLYPDSFTTPASFWDLVAREVRLARRPYVNIGMRTDAPGSRQYTRVLAVFEALAEHPLAARLEIVDPLDAVQALLPGTVFEPALAG